VKALLFRPVPAVTALVVMALGARLVWSAWTAPVPPPLTDPQYYNAAALSLTREQGYRVAFDDSGFQPGGDPTAFWPPGYPAYLGGFYELFGEGAGVARTANAIAGALTVVPVYLAGRRLFGESAALAGAGIAALLPSLVFWTPVLFSETFFTLLFVSAAALFLHAVGPGRSPAMGAAVAGGLVVGTAALVRGPALVLLPLAFTWWLATGARPRQAAALFAAAVVATAAVLAPWALRNARVMDSPIVLSANFGYNLRIGHAPYSTGRYLAPQDLWDEQPGITFQEREVLFNDLGTRRAIDYAGGNPGREVELSARKVVALWRPDSDVLVWVSSHGRTPLPARAWEPLRLLLDTTYLALLALSAGALAAFRQLRSSLVFPVLLVLLWTAAHVVFFGEPRYHLPVLAFLAPMAGWTLLWLARPLLRARAGPAAH